MSRVVIVSHRASRSANDLVGGLNLSLSGDSLVTRRVVTSTRSLRALRPDVAINWGSSSMTLNGEVNINPRILYNNPLVVNNAANKITAFRIWNQEPRVDCLENTTDINTARSWILNGADKAYCRTTVRGNSGEGIVIAREADEIVEAPLYTKGVDIHHEYRFHVVNDVVIDGVRKAFRSDIPEEDRNREVMNHAAGTIFIRSGPAFERVSQNQDVLQLAVNAVSSLGLDFGAVDILCDREGNHYVIEVNTACGLEGTTLESYTRAFTELINGDSITPWSLTNETNEQIGTIMNISEARQGQQVIFNPSGNSTISTLTRGNQYQIERVSLTVVFIRNDNGRLQPYQPRHFQLVIATQPLTEAQGPLDGSVDTSNPPDSPLRIVLLEDGSSVNVTGHATFNGSSQRIQQGQHEIADIRVGNDTGDVFIGVQQGDYIFRFRATNFSDGSVVGLHENAEIVANSLQDINNRNIQVGNNVEVMVHAGGHGLLTGTLCVVTAIDAEARALTVSVDGTSNIRIHPSRVRLLTERQYSAILAEREALRTQGTTDFTIGSHNYRVPTVDLPVLEELLRRFTV